jgi:UDP-N-acetylmuramoylalanine--D-glutamate ligase
MASALAKAGADVLVVDQKPADALEMISAIDRLAGKGIEVRTSWSGDVDWKNTDIVVPSPGVPQTHPALVASQRHGVTIWSEVEVAYQLAKSPIVAITGTNGKSTVTALTHHILKMCGAKSVLCGNIAGSGYEEKPIASAAISGSETDILVAEVSSFQLEWIDEFRPARATITRIAADHLDRYKSFEDYRQTKLKVFANQTEADVAVINVSRPETIPQDMRSQVLRYGAADADVAVAESYIESKGIRVDAASMWATGRHNLENAAAAWILASTYVPIEQAADAILSFRGIANRMEMVAERNGRRFVNNSMCTNPDALLASLDAAQPPVILISGGVSKVDLERAFDTMGSKGVKAAVLFGKDGTRLAKAFAAQDISTQVVSTLEEAFNRAYSLSGPGDTVLLSPGCASFDQYSDFIERGEAFRAIVREHIGEESA